MTNETSVLYGVWAWENKQEVLCSSCRSIIGVAFNKDSYEELALENKYCYNCGLRMLSLSNMVSAVVDGVVYE